MARVKYVMLLPLTYNDRSRVPKDVLNQLKQDLYVLAGGYYVAGSGEGAYRMKSGAKQVDHSLEVWVAVEPADEKALKALVSNFAAILGQESIYLERAGGTVEFVQPTLALGG